MSVTVKEMFDFAIETDLSLSAHTIYWALSNNLIDLLDDDSKLHSIDLDKQAIDALVKNNTLGIGKNKLFVIQTSKSGWFAFYLAENSLAAYSLHSDLFREQGGKITQSDRLMIPTMLLADTGEEVSLYEYRKRVVHYPAYIGHAKAGEHILYRMGVSA